MDVIELANNYAEGKANKAITNAIAQAYLDGFNDGYHKGKENAQLTMNSNTEFIDLGLPSGTLWASDYLKDSDGNVCYLPYKDAKKHNIPTEEQFNELRKCCQWNYDECGHYCLGPNGNKILFNNTGYIEVLNHIYTNIQAYMWLKDEGEGVNKKSSTIYVDTSRQVKFPLKYVCVCTIMTFSGFKLPVRLVR